MSLEDNINKYHLDIKIYTLHFMKIGKPFEYMKRLARVGNYDYGVSSKESFEAGLEANFKWYKKHKKETDHMKTQFYALKQGAEEIIKYVDNHRKKNE